MAVGWVDPITINETSFGNTSVDNDSVLGAQMARTMLSFYKRWNVPIILLTMDGQFDPAVGPGDWGMRSWFVDRYGNISKAAQEMLRFVGADPNPDIAPEGDPPDAGVDPDVGLIPMSARRRGSASAASTRSTGRRGFLTWLSDGGAGLAGR